MTSGAKVGLTIAGIFGLLIVWFISSYFSYANQAVDFETRIEYGVEDNKQKLGQYRLGVSEAVQTLGLGADLQGDKAVEQINARYGEGGSKAVMQWITENNIAAVSQDQLVAINRQIQAGRQGFADAQTRLLDVCRGYERLQRRPYSGFWMNITGYPSYEYTSEGGNGKLCRAVTSKGATEAFDSGIEDALDIRSGAPDA